MSCAVIVGAGLQPHQPAVLPGFSIAMGVAEQRNEGEAHFEIDGDLDGELVAVLAEGDGMAAHGLAAADYVESDVT